MKPAYYNENEPYAAQHLRNLISAGLIAPGDVDERSIEDVGPDDLAGYGQCHFFAGVGVWSYALRRAGVPDDFPVWTGSCPCQPYSIAGKGAGNTDKRHLWPAWFRLIRARRPELVLGEQVEAAIRHGWLDDLCADLEGEGYACGSAVLGAHSVGAPHIRQRLYWVAHASGTGLEGRHQGALGDECTPSERGGRTGGMADTPGPGWQRRRSGEAGDGRDATWQQSERFCNAGGMAHADSDRREPWGTAPEAARYGHSAGPDGGAGRPSPTDGFWRAADWLYCRDGKWRPVEPGASPLAHGAPARVGRLRAYGNAICAETARAFIEAVMQTQYES